MNGHLASVILFIVSSSALAKQAVQQTPLHSDESRTLIVGSEQEYPPFAKGMTDETASGFTVELWKAIAGEQDLKFKIKVLPFKSLLSEFKAKRIDVMLNLAQSPERRKFAEFSIPHSSSRGAVFVKKTNSTIFGESDIEEKSVVLLSGDLSEDYARERYPNKDFTVEKTAELAFKRLERSEVDAFLISKLAGAAVLKKLKLNDQIENRCDAGFNQEFSIAVHAGEYKLLQQINEGFILLHESAEYDRLFKKWFGFQQRQGDHRGWPNYSIIAVLSVIIAALAVQLIRYIQQRKNHTLELRQTEAMIRTAFENSLVGMCHTRLDGRYLKVNQKYCEILGYSENELLQKTFMQVTHPDDIEPDLHLFQSLLEGEISSFQLDKRYITKDGHHLWCRIFVSLIPIPYNNEQTVLTTIANIHQDILNRRELENERERYRGLLEMSKDPAIVVTSCGRISDINLQAVLQFDISDNEAVGAPLSILENTLRNSKIEQAFKEASEGQLVQWEGVDVGFKGERLKIDISAYRIELTTGYLIKIDLHDSTERYQLMSKAKELAGKLALALEAGQIGYCTYNIETGEFLIDDRLDRILGLELEDACVRRSFRATLRKLRLREYWRLVRNVREIRDNHISHTIINIPSSEGRQELAIEVRCQRFNLSEEGGEILVAACFDITNQVQNSQDLKRTNAELVSATAARDKMLAKLSHELRTPLNVILGFGQLLDQRLSGSEDHELVSRILESGEHLLAMISDLLLLSDSSISFDASGSDVVDVLAEVVRVCSLLGPLAMARDVRLELEETDPNDDRALIVGNTRSFRQVLLNVIDNAIKYNRAGGHVKITCGLNAGDMAVVSVSDTGIGIPSEESERLFAPFYRGWEARSSATGTGLGLSITRELVDKMGGMVSLSSSEGVGSTFVLTFPRAPVDDPAVSEGNLILARRLSKLRVMIIDCTTQAGEESEFDSEDYAELKRTRDALLDSSARAGRFATIDCMVSSELTQIKQMRSDVYVLLIRGTKDLVWVRELQKSAITRKQPCYVLLPKGLSPHAREIIMAAGEDCGPDAFLRWSSFRQLSRDLELMRKNRDFVLNR